MKKSFLVMAIFLAATAAVASLDGVWEGSCTDYADHIMRGTYNYKFSNGQVETFLQYYSDQMCAKDARSSVVPQAMGTYTVNTSSMENSREVYNITMTMAHQPGPKAYTIIIENNVMQICASRCWSYTRR